MNKNMNKNIIKQCPVTGSVVCRCEINQDVIETLHSSVNMNAIKPDLKDLLRKLFTDHAVFTKMYIESVLHDLPDSALLAKRLFANQEEIGVNVGFIVGENKGMMLSNLLKQHIQLASNAVVLAKNHQDLLKAKKEIFINSAQVAKFLSELNNKILSYDVVKKHFDQHNVYVLEIVTLHLEKKYDAEIKKYDEYYNHMLMFSDLLCAALSVPMSTKAETFMTESNTSNCISDYGYLVILMIIFVLLLWTHYNKY